MEFDKILLKPMSWQILSYLASQEPQKAEEIANNLGLSTRQVDAAVTKSLVRYGFVIREAKLTRLMKKEYNLIKVTERGKQYVAWKHEKDAAKGRA